MAKGVHRGQFSRKRLIDMEQRGVPISAATAGHEGNPRASDISGPNVYPDGYSGGHYAPSTTTNGTMGTVNGYPVSHAGNDRGANGGYNTRGYA